MFHSRKPASIKSLLLLPLPIPLLDPRAAFLATFSGGTLGVSPSSTAVSLSILPPPTAAGVPLPSLPAVPWTPAAAATAAPAGVVVASTSAVVMAAEEPPAEVPSDELDVHEVAISAAVAAVLLKLPTRGLAEVGDRGEVGDDGAGVVEPSVERLEGLGGLVLLAELDVDIADHVVGEIVADIEALDLAELCELREDVLVEVLEVLLDLARVQRLPLRIHPRRDHVGTLVHVGQQQRWRDAWPVVQPRTPVAVPARADLEVERTVDAILLRPEDRCQVLRHAPVRNRFLRFC